ncbi:hypothetical protein LTR78_007969 [Recurvomyces mirabilis]|uniref:Uncharacterized protein n=1 Tax=Recurvomyces mirabilis TaxID=574656 RepID=A0AAE0TQZ6_9PEZI|nr:hypothetical protein LTR78_007969 [Recurvomyces mirabilis]KAK4574056.1 hypothetical protein LTR86_001817 [Recurvomyces mirabilis]KAK5152505.1 hypothetical protein LTS14_008452 [Recurvomyces mirabilis]
MPAILPRQYGYGYGYGNGYYNTPWNSWVRWLVLALIIIGAFLIFFLFSCITARRRRRLGHQPFRGTAWAAGRTPPGHAPAQYNGNAQPYYNNSNAPPPAYGAASSYYGPQTGNDVELQQPQPVYGSNAHKDNYAPPAGPPPGRS